MKILVIDDEEDIGKFIKDVAEIMNINCETTTNVTDFMNKLNVNTTFIIMDLMMPDVDGVEILRMLKQQVCKSKIILMSGVDKRVLEVAEELAKSLELSVIGHLLKPFRQADLEKIIKMNMMDSPSAKAMQPMTKPVDITEQALQQAIEQDEFVIYYQPQLELATDRMKGVEALVRWQHPEHGLVFPDSFISKAEDLGMIGQLDWLIAKKALPQIAQCIEQRGAPFTLSLNASPHSLQDLKFPDALLALAEKCHMRPENIVIEVIESGLFKELSKALDILTRLRMKKIKLSIDDFGAGFAMMQQLQRVPATELKIDKSFIKNMLEQDNARIMVLKIIEMGHELGMEVVAEGIETAEQLAFLKANHCDVIQSYFYSHPLSFSALQEWLKTH